MLKVCRVYGLEKAATDFPKNHTYSSGRAGQYRDRNKTAANKFKISHEEAAQLYETDACEICHSAPSHYSVLAIDHDHLTGKIRGMLCDACNKGLGLFKDSPELLEKAATYLKSRAAK